MEKYLFVVSSAFILVVLLNASAVTSRRNNPAFVECKLAENVTDDDLRNMRDRNQTKSRPMKCILTCIAEKEGKIINNKLIPDGVTNWFKNTTFNFTEQMQERLNEVIQECRNVGDTDRCEAGMKIMDCLKDGLSARGLKPPFHGGRGQERKCWNNVDTSLTE